MRPSEIEKKWQAKWDDTKLYRFEPKNVAKKQYILEMFSYPSGANLHVGHWYNYGLTDSYARFKRMQGYEVFQPQGFDAFGLPAENYAIKTGIHPMDSTRANIAKMEEQLKRMGATFDWDYEVKTCDPDYYRWTQWCFLQLYHKGLAYRKEAPVNWCPSCNTVLANEQVIDGECERCQSPVKRKLLTQWFFKITAYAEELLSKLDELDWPEKTKIMQRNWIGKSIGGEITFDLEDGSERFTVFTTRADTLYGCTYVVVAPEHPIVGRITTPEHKDAVQAYIDYAAKASDIDRMSTVREKTGCFTGAYAINPVNGRKIPIYVADYVLYTYGTGVVMAVPAHDERDYEFAQKYDLPIERVIKGVNCPDDLPFTEYGVLVNSMRHDGETSQEALKTVIEELKTKDAGAFKTNYRLRDWLISRQRYWGAPIPIVYCEKCGAVPVPESELPVLLPYDVDFTPDGTSPLLKSDAFINCACPKCGGAAKRDADTMDTFVCSSWYFLRYPDNKNEKEAWNKEWIDSMLPVDKYVGGAEHACLHLLYSRFFVKALRDLGHLSFDEPFLSLVHQGTILGPDGQKMSKSLGNTVSPDECIQKFGSDVFRMYLMFGFSYIEGGVWSEDGIKAISRFVERVERLCARVSAIQGKGGALDKELRYALNYAVKQMTLDYDRFQFNTAIARAMELTNALYKYADSGAAEPKLFADTIKTLLLLLAPAMPHLAEELWEQLGGTYSIFNQPWPSVDESALALDEIELGVQLNGKIRARVKLAAGLSKDEIERAVLADEAVKAQLEGKNVRKVIVAKNIVNIVVG